MKSLPRHIIQNVSCFMSEIPLHFRLLFCNARMLFSKMLCRASCLRQVSDDPALKWSQSVYTQGLNGSKKTSFLCLYECNNQGTWLCD